MHPIKGLRPGLMVSVLPKCGYPHYSGIRLNANEIPVTGDHIELMNIFRSSALEIFFKKKHFLTLKKVSKMANSFDSSIIIKTHPTFKML